MFFNPFEQFIINPFFELSFIIIDATLTNITLSLFVLLFVTGYYSLRILPNNQTGSFYLTPRAGLDSLVYIGVNSIQTLLDRHIAVPYYRQIFFPLVFALATFLLIMNLAGTIPGCMSLTSQIAVICSLVVPIVIGLFIWSLFQRGLTFLRTFHAPGMSSSLAICLFPVEVITYVVRPISLMARLFSNFMSGHVILKVLLGALVKFGSIKLTGGIVCSLISTGFLLGLIPLAMLELAICLIQVYVFVLIFCMFLSDSFGHHFRH